MARQTLLTAAIVLGAATHSWGQNAALTPINNWSYMHHSSTYAEGVLRGNASVIQAAGQANYLNSVAAVNYQEARRQALENSKLYVKTYYENKEISRQYREKYAKPPMTPERWSRIIASALPDRLTPDQYDPSTGALVWPHVLRMDRYEVVREAIDDLLAQRTPENSGDGSPFQRELATLIATMKALLNSNVDTLTSTQFGDALEFLRSLDFEAKQPLPSADSPAAASPSDVAVAAN
ncbi:MAG: hypothetical protein KDB22_28990 [Planctomycetales bacterium]|nr:hypothetical protein [Planctomycetales bacterium]